MFGNIGNIKPNVVVNHVPDRTTSCLLHSHSVLLHTRQLLHPCCEMQCSSSSFSIYSPTSGDLPPHRPMADKAKEHLDADMAVLTLFSELVAVSHGAAKQSSPPLRGETRSMQAHHAEPHCKLLCQTLQLQTFFYS